MVMCVWMGWIDGYIKVSSGKEQFTWLTLRIFIETDIDTWILEKIERQTDVTNDIIIVHSGCYII